MVPYFKNVVYPDIRGGYMQQLENSIVNAIVQYIRQSNIPFSDWYVGIAENAQVRLFEEHCVNKDLDYWIFRDCITVDTARRIEEIIISNYHTDGGPGGGSYNSRFVYAYKKESHTREEYHK